MYKLKNIRLQIAKLFSEYNISKDEVDKLICESLKINFSKMLMIDEITDDQYNLILNFANERILGKPITKIFNTAYFFGLTLTIDENVLSPRQETEILVEQALNYINNNNLVLDLCTGSGAIALAIKSKVNANVFASDISKKALKIAKLNANNLQLDVNFILSDLFTNIDQKFDVIVSNPPYIKKNYINLLDNEVKNYDPILALDGGEDGLMFYKLIIKDCKKYLNSNGKILFEIGYDQAQDVKNLLKNENFDVKIVQDFENRDRVVIGILKE